MIVTRGFSKKSTLKGGTIVTHGYGLIQRTILRMKVVSRELKSAVSAKVEGREVGP